MQITIPDWVISVILTGGGILTLVVLGMILMLVLINMAFRSGAWWPF